MNKIIKLIKLLMPCSFIILLSACNSSQQQLIAGKKSFQEQNYRDAFVRLQPLANAGDPDAQYAVGYMYYYGQGVIEDHHKSLLMLQRAASQGQMQAQQAVQLLNNSDRTHINNQTL